MTCALGAARQVRLARYLRRVRRFRGGPGREWGGVLDDEVVIESLGAGGDGFAAGVFVPFTLPGERVAISRRGQRAELQRVIEPSADRVTPVCPHFGQCGGCALQHGSDSLVAAWKRDLVVRALASRGIEGVEVRDVLTSPPASRRRITLSARRTRKGVIAGFHAAGSDEIVAIESCPVAHPDLVAAIPRLDEVIERAASRTSEVKITLTRSDAGIDCAVHEAKVLNNAGLALLSGVGVRAKVARLSWNGDPAITLKRPVQIVGRAHVVPPPGGFLQATPAGEAALVEAVREAVGSAAVIVDLFSGSGTFALPLAEQAEIKAYDAEREALEALDQAWRGAEGLRRIETERRELFHRPVLASELKNVEAAVIDPPRAGARAQAGQLAQSRVPLIASVSCNPTTFARDARILLDGGYRLDWVQPVDQFRWSSHVELAARFSRV